MGAILADEPLRRSSLMRQPSAFSKLMAQVALPSMPILCSSARTCTPLSSPLSPVCGLMRRLGTRNTLTEARPGARRPLSSGTLASTMWAMFSVMSWSPPEMKIFSPLMR